MGRTWTPSQEAAMQIDGKTLLVSAAAGAIPAPILFASQIFLFTILPVVIYLIFGQSIPVSDTTTAPLPVTVH